MNADRFGTIRNASTSDASALNVTMLCADVDISRNSLKKKQLKLKIGQE